jgi:cytoskeletal protein RodZ
VTEWESVDERNNREKINRARQAAEDLFRPTESTSDAMLAPASEEVSSAAPQPRRQPRIFEVPARAPVSAGAEIPIRSKSITQKALPRRETRSISPSQVGRVRALTSYGMTRAQVAELYGVTIEEIERVIRAPGTSRRSR